MLESNHVQRLKNTARDLFTQMATAFQSRPAGLVESYTSDFYTIDAEMLGDQIAEGGSYLWMWTPSGTHFGTIGVLPVQATYMQAALRNYMHNYSADRLRLFAISVPETGLPATLKPITFDDGLALIRSQSERSTYRLTGQQVTKNGKPIAEVKIIDPDFRKAPRDYALTVTSSTGIELGRRDALACVALANDAVVRRSDLFARFVDIHIDSRPIDEVVPRVFTREDGAQFIPKAEMLDEPERQAAPHPRG